MIFDRFRIIAEPAAKLDAAATETERTQMLQSMNGDGKSGQTFKRRLGRLVEKEEGVNTLAVQNDPKKDTPKILKKILKKNYSRIPVYYGKLDKKLVIGILLTKSLIGVNP